MVRARVVPVSGPVAMVGLSALHTAEMGGSHPLAKKVGAWPSVVAVAAVTAAASELVTRDFVADALGPVPGLVTKIADPVRFQADTPPAGHPAQIAGAASARR
jgi:hypothetical protein